MHDKMPTDEKLIERGCNLPSICNLCSDHNETTFHILFDCPYAVRIWTWFSAAININLHFNNVEDIWKLCDRGWSPQCKVVIKAAIINILATIWFVRNQARFNNKKIHWNSAINLISSSVSLTGNYTKLTSTSSMIDFQVLKKFNIHIHPPRALVIKEVMWSPPLHNWIKGNSDGSATSTSSACGIIFRNSISDSILCVAENLGVGSAFIAEICGAMRAIEIAHQRNWTNFWLETDSMLVVVAFANDTIVPWNLCNRWCNCKKLTLSMNFVISHIFREGNQCVDSLANVGLSIQGLFSWETAPAEVLCYIGRNKLGLPSFRFMSF